MEHKIVIVGDGGVGKSALTIQFISNHFIVEYDPTIEDAYRKQINVDGEVCMLNILDTAGQDEYSAMRDQYMRTGQGFVLVYSVTSKNSFTKMDEFRSLAQRVKDNDKVPIVLVGNKCDLENERQVTTAEGGELAKSWNSVFLEASAFTRKNVDEIFDAIVREIRKASGKEVKKSKKKLSIQTLTKSMEKIHPKFKNCNTV